MPYTTSPDIENSQAALAYTHPLKQNCTQFLSRHQPKSVQEWLALMATSKYSKYQLDAYGQGLLVQELEQRMADLLGKQRALFCHKGMVVQLSVLKHWSELRQNPRIAFQPKSHIDYDEMQSYKHLLNLEQVPIGNAKAPFSAEDLPVATQVAAISVELPHRRAGFLLPEWQDLLAARDYCDANATALHFDGARLLESASYWHKTPAEVCQLSDSVYVSFYKSMGAIAGSVVAAEADTVEAMQPWKSRMGGEIHSAFPYVISAMWGLDHYLPKIGEFIEQAKHVSKLVCSVLGEAALPFKVQSNSFVVTLPGSPEETARRALAIAKTQHKWLFDSVMADATGGSRVEIQIGDAINKWTDEEIIDVFAAFV